MTLWHQGIFFSLRKEEGDERDGDDAANRGDERHLGDERRIAAVFQTEHRAETRYRHRYNHRIDVVDQIAYTTYLEQEIDAQRYYAKAQKRGNIYLRTAFRHLPPLSDGSTDRLATKVYHAEPGECTHL